MARKLKLDEIDVQEIAYHRNGVAGYPFYAVRFRWSVDGKAENFLGTLFDGDGQCSVISLDRIAQHGVAFGPNSWRGDVVERRLRAAVKKWIDQTQPHKR